MNWTPGPWHLRYPGPDVIAGDDLVCSLVVSHDTPNDIADADANLIAAAPRLYEELNAAVNDLQATYEACKVAGPEISIGQWVRLDAMRAALKSARGEKS